MRFLCPCLLALLTLVPTSRAAAGETKSGTSVVFIEEVHATSDALDSVVVLPDIFRRTSVSIEHVSAIEGGVLTLGAGWNETRFSDLDFEDDRALSLELKADMQLGDRVEFRGALGYGWSDEGDDFPIGDLVLGMRTTTHTLSAGAEIGVDLGRGFSLIVAAAQRRSFAGDTHFEEDILPPLRLEADKSMPTLALGLRHSHGERTFGLSARYSAVDLQQGDALTEAYSARLLALMAELALKRESGVALGLSFGVEALRGEAGIVEQVRPALRATVQLPLGPRVTFAASLAAGFDLDDTDDPLGSWRERGEIELAIALREALMLGAGIFAERTKNLVLEETEHAHGAYAEIEYRVSDTVSVLLRGDWEQIRSPLFRPAKRRQSAFLRIKASI
ncbi:hypothetical protein GN330_07875 [Nitratireductor sp. CAU 1489]|uniref:Uncharacterized protein n=1 Tax=Nitratireductor arenosus TaxID=2682096 RepID=A0A844QD47_9HYPH|nr:hypothetical protein [Nitratireductor arenosus]MVA97165.1 hypothetical protein [Nitratireductor arenosus]